MQIFRSLSITGASSGIGEATAELLAAKGAKVVLGARRADLLATLTERIRQAGGHAVYLQMDVTKRTEVASLVQLALDEFGRLDVIISNAGISQLQLLEDVDVEGWEQMIDLLTTADVAYALGFEHPQSFNKLFKQKTGMSPAAFRKLLNPN